ncbi:hypothetical protein PENSUB_996 [Penicillium subrubescens]|uniref:Uncharacterized protein n=1 Tax=Penicillium subrubescens TaxID=1316194 RepID=A0A1Q5ULA5_9EURO|nr:hypothetical protein PENSUB_996 [Penicillium subrubescens]
MGSSKQQTLAEEKKESESAWAAGGSFKGIEWISGTQQKVQGKDNNAREFLLAGLVR